MMIFKRSYNWTLITIADSAHLSGKSISNVMRILLKVIKFKFVVFDDIIGAKTSILIDKSNTVLQIDCLLKIVDDVVQFDWGDFFLFEEYPTNWVKLQDLTHSEIIAQTDTTVRAVDDGYIYIYTPYKEIIEIIKENNQIESIKTDSLDKLDFPF